MTDLFAPMPPAPRSTASSAALRAFDPRHHRCHCGAWGSRSPNHFADRPGQWFCRAHYPAEPNEGRP